MNMGSSAMACSGFARFSNTAWAAAQHRSSVSVSSMAASRIVVGMRLRTVIAVSNGLFTFMGRSFLRVVAWGVHRIGLDRPALVFLGAWAGGVVRFHAYSLFFLSGEEMATDGNARCGLLREVRS